MIQSSHTVWGGVFEKVGKLRLSEKVQLGSDQKKETGKREKGKLVLSDFKPPKGRQTQMNLRMTYKDCARERKFWEGGEEYSISLKENYSTYLFIINLE